MKLKVTIPAKEVEIDRCYHTCPHFALDGGPSSIMYCSHPYWNDKGSYAGCIISHPQCDTGFPDQCPLLKENGIVQNIPKNEEKEDFKLKMIWNDIEYELTDEEKKLPMREQLSIIINKTYQKIFDEFLIKKLTESQNENQAGTN